MAPPMIVAKADGKSLAAWLIPLPVDLLLTLSNVIWSDDCAGREIALKGVNKI